MASHHRLLWIDAQIRAGRHPNASSVAARFEISRRQAARDLEYLRYSLGAPLEYVAAQRGYRYADDRFFVPALVLSGDERAALAEIAHRYESAGSRSADMAGLFRRISATAPDPAAGGDPGDGGDGQGGDGDRADRDGGTSWYGGPRTRPAAARLPGGMGEASAAHRLRRAIDERRVVEIVYRDQVGRGTARRFRPVALSDGDDGLRVSGWCELRGANRALRVDGIMLLRATPDTFEADEAPTDPHRASLTFGSRVGEPYRAVVRFPGGIVPDHVPGTRSLGDGRTEVEFRASAPLLAALLSGPRFVIERPRWLRARLEAHLRAVLDDNLA